MVEGEKRKRVKKGGSGDVVVTHFAEGELIIKEGTPLADSQHVVVSRGDQDTLVLTDQTMGIGSLVSNSAIWDMLRTGKPVQIQKVSSEDLSHAAQPKPSRSRGKSKV